MTRRTLVLLSILALAACADAGFASDAPEAFPPGPSDAGAGPGWDGGTGFCCTSNADCPTSYTCEQCACRPPEVEKDRTTSHRPPAASPHYVYALNPTADTVARIDPATLGIEAITVGAQPVDLAAMSTEDVAVALSYVDRSVSIIDSTSLPSRVTRVPLKRQYERLSVSPDGAFAVAWPDPSKPPPAGAEGIVAVVNLQLARTGAVDRAQFERAVGFRVTDVVFRMSGGAATRAYVVAKDTLSDIDLLEPQSDKLPARFVLPASMSAHIDTREVSATGDGAHLVLRSMIEPELAYFDGTSIRTVPLAELATDLDLLADGSAAVAALRASGSLAFIEIPADLLDPTGIQIFEVGGELVGQVVLPETAGQTRFALVYSNATDHLSFARVDLPSGLVTRFALQKLVDEIDLAPDGHSAVIIHRPGTGAEAADDYERSIALAQGYSVFDVSTGYVQLKTTADIEPGPFAFSPVGGYVGVALRDEVGNAHKLDTVDLRSLVTNTLSLMSAPLFMGPVPEAQGTSRHRVFVSQSHSAGRISVVNLDDGQVRTATGFTLNAEIE